MALHIFLLFHLRRHVKNSGFVLHHKFQTPRNNKSTRPAASCFHHFFFSLFEYFAVRKNGIKRVSLTRLFVLKVTIQYKNAETENVDLDLFVVQYLSPEEIISSIVLLLSLAGKFSLPLYAKQKHKITISRHFLSRGQARSNTDTSSFSKSSVFPRPHENTKTAFSKNSTLENAFKKVGFR